MPDECPRCLEDVLVVPYQPPDAKAPYPLALNPEPLEVFVVAGGRIQRVEGMRRHQSTCEALERGVGAVEVPEDHEPEKDVTPAGNA